MSNETKRRKRAIHAYGQPGRTKCGRYASDVTCVFTEYAVSCRSCSRGAERRAAKKASRK